MPELQLREPLIFELSKPGRQAGTQFPPRVAGTAQVPPQLRRAAPAALPEVLPVESPPWAAVPPPSPEGAVC